MPAFMRNFSRRAMKAARQAYQPNVLQQNRFFAEAAAKKAAPAAPASAAGAAV